MVIRRPYIAKTKQSIHLAKKEIKHRLNVQKTMQIREQFAEKPGIINKLEPRPSKNTKPIKILNAEPLKINNP